MVKHIQWRKLAKKARRKRIRQHKAKLRDALFEEEQKQREQSPTYQKWLEDERIAEEFRLEEVARLARQAQENWQKREEEARKEWKKLQEKIFAAREERTKQNAKIKIEWEKEQQRLKELKEQKERELEAKRRLQEKLNEEVDRFIEDGGSTPEHLKTVHETNPGKITCPFFSKVGSCRFYDVCSRNHARPAVSNTLLVPNFFAHYSLEAAENEHGTDSGLEFEVDELHKAYKEFFYDVVPEFEKCGQIKHFRTCHNHESHLRGNVYVQYSTTRAALISYRTFNGRWYGGKQLSVEFCSIPSWKAAICGLHFHKKCPKGNACNFLHVFRNPQNMYSKCEEESQRRNSRREYSVESNDRRNWRWSESPERTYTKCMGWSSDEDEKCHRKYHKRRRKSRSNSRERHKESDKKHRSSKKKRRSKSKSRSSHRSSRS